MATHLREVLEAIAWSKQGLTDDKDAVALLDMHLKRVQECQHNDELSALIEVRDAAVNAIKNVKPLIAKPLVKSHAEQLEKALGPLLRLVSAQQNDTAKPKYLAEKKKLAADIQKYDGLVAAGAFKGAAAAALADFHGAYAKGRAAMDDGEKAGDFVSALDLGIAETRRALTVVWREAKEAYEASYTPVKATMDAVGQAIAAKGDFATLAKKLQDDATQAAAGLKTPAAVGADGQFAAAYAALATAQAAAKAFRTGAAQLVLSTAKDGNKTQRQRARRQADEMLRSDPDALRHMLELDGGKEALDAMVGDVGEKASDDEDKAFVGGALRARFNIDAHSGLTTKALPRMYKVLSQVPEGHTVNNPKLTAIEREQKNGTSTYGGGKLVLNVPKTGRIHNNTRNFDPDDEVPKDWKVSSKNVSDFDQVTLHELGHSVDDKLGFMDSKGKSATYGGWKMHNAADVAELAGKERGFFKDFAQFPQAMLRQVLVTALDGAFPDKAFWTQEKAMADTKPTRGWLLTNEVVIEAEAERDRLGGDWSPMATTHKRSALGLLAGKYPPQKEVLKRIVEAILQENQPAKAAVDGVLDSLEAVGDPPADQVWQQMSEHAAVKWCMKVGRRDVWKLGRAGAQENADAAGTAAYVRSSGMTWHSYLLSARVKCVSSYQFNAPAEWFAELYAAYYMDKLPESHPDYAWLTSEIHEAA